MTTTIHILDLPKRWDEALRLSEAGHEIVLSDERRRARLVPIAAPTLRVPRVPGLHPGSMQMSADFDDPLPGRFWTDES